MNKNKSIKERLSHWWYVSLDDRIAATIIWTAVIIVQLAAAYGAFKLTQWMYFNL